MQKLSNLTTAEQKENERPLLKEKNEGKLVCLFLRQFLSIRKSKVKLKITLLIP